MKPWIRPKDPALRRREEADLRVWDVISQLRGIQDHETMMQVSQVGTSPIDGETKGVNGRSERSSWRVPAAHFLNDTLPRLRYIEDQYGIPDKPLDGYIKE